MFLLFLCVRLMLVFLLMSSVVMILGCLVNVVICKLDLLC